jgi:hypothetical protein
MFSVGIAVDVAPAPFRRGVVAYVGAVKGLPPGEWYGVRLDNAEGKNDGSVKGERYFECEPKHGCFVPRKNLKRVASNQDDSEADGGCVAPAEQPAKAGLKAQMDARHAARDAERLRKTAQQEDTYDPMESSAAFLKTFNAKQAAIQSAVDVIIAGQDDARGSGKLAVLESLDKLKGQVKEMSKDVADASRYLAGYDARQSQVALANMTALIAQTQATVAPRKKFTFKSRGIRAAKLAAAGPQAAPELSQPAALKPTAVMTYEIPEEGFNFTDRKNEVLDIKPGQLQQESGKGVHGASDGRLEGLENCTVLIRDSASGIRVNNLKNCKVYAGPVAGSIHLTNCVNCTFVIATRQIRIHDTYNTDFYIHVASNPIFEDSSGLRFTAYNLEYPELAQQMVDSGLGAMENQWRQVDDFKWLRSQQSPNWCVLPAEDEAVGVISGSMEQVSSAPATPLQVAVTPAAPAAPAAPAPAAEPQDGESSDDEL